MQTLPKLTCGVLTAAVLALMPVAALAADSAGSLVADGMEVYYSVLPSEMIRGYPKGSREYTMHGGVPGDPHNHHVMVALFEAKTLKRITDATVTATVAEIGMAGTTETLEPMTVADVRTYGNYFYFSDLAVYEIAIKIRRPGSDDVVTASFRYRHH